MSASLSPNIFVGDNDAANNLCAEDFISTGNKYIYTPYHWIKELVKGKFIEVHRKPTKETLVTCIPNRVSERSVLS